MRQRRRLLYNPGWPELRDQLQRAMTARIAIIDDDAGVRESTRQLLRSQGYLTLAFASAEDFLKSGEVAEASCVVTDVRMPGMSGVALQAWLKAQGSTIPMIFVTAFPEPKIQEQVLAAGALAYLAKPYQAASLINCIESVLKD
jgi:FixJ family two-component response regulator